MWKPIAISLMIVTILTGCATGPKEIDIVKSRTVNVSRAKCIDRAVAWLTDAGLSVESAATNSTVVKASGDLKSYQGAVMTMGGWEASKYCADCGKGPAGKFVVNDAQVSVLFAEVSEGQTKVTVNLAAKNINSLWTKCFSNGVLEKELLDAIEGK